MKMKDIQSKSTDELKKILEESRDKLRGMNFKVSSDQMKDVRDIRSIKKSIARILTHINKKRHEGK